MGWVVLKCKLKGGGEAVQFEVTGGAATADGWVASRRKQTRPQRGRTHSEP